MAPARPSPQGKSSLATLETSSEPQLHIQVNRATVPWGGPPRPLPFNGIQVLDLLIVDPNVWPPNTDAPWNSVSAQDLPIWPGPLRLGKKKLWIVLAWAWIIIIGGLMITPGGIECIVCGPTLTKLLGVVSIVLGVSGLVNHLLISRALQAKPFGQVQSQKGDLDN